MFINVYSPHVNEANKQSYIAETAQPKLHSADQTASHTTHHAARRTLAAKAVEKSEKMEESRQAPRISGAWRFIVSRWVYTLRAQRGSVMGRANPARW